MINAMFAQMGIFNIALVLILYRKARACRNEYHDCLLFSRLLLATVAILVVDTIGWLVDGNPLFGQLWFTIAIDGLDLFFTTLVCWCWVQYAVYIAKGENLLKKSFSFYFSTGLLILQALLVASSQIYGFYYYVDSAGFYHRGDAYLIHTLISLSLLLYSSVKCVYSFYKEEDSNRRKELLFVALIILLPICGNIFQLYVYGYPTVWLCMVFMIVIIYIHIQTKRTNRDRNQQNEILRKALVQAEAANDAKTDFLTRMSHDMRTPMNGILGITKLMEDESSVEEMKSELPKITASGHYLLQLINDVLDVNKIESGKIELLPVACDEEAVFDSIISMTKPLMDAKNIEFHFEKINIVWTDMLLDAQRVRQIFINLLSNAAKFTPEGGRIDWIMELVSEDEHMIRDKFIIRDSGIGISPEFLPKIFLPFEQEGRLHEDLGGSGLGLSIVKSLVELMGGTIDVKSELNKGTEFTLYLNFPLVKKSDLKTTTSANITTPEVHSETSSPSNGMHAVLDPKAFQFERPVQVLLCEDHPLNAEITTRLLEKAGARVIWNEDGQAGVDSFQNSELNYFDVILMDIRMPVLDGLGAAKTIRNLDRSDAKTVPIIAMTANAFEEDINRSISAGMNAHLAKPVEPGLMYETINSYIRQCS